MAAHLVRPAAGLAPVLHLPDRHRRLLRHRDRSLDAAGASAGRGRRADGRRGRGGDPPPRAARAAGGPMVHPAAERAGEPAASHLLARPSQGRLRSRRARQRIHRRPDRPAGDLAAHRRRPASLPHASPAALPADDHGALDRGRGDHVHAGGDRHRGDHPPANLQELLRLPSGGPNGLARCAQCPGRARPAVSRDDHLHRAGLHHVPLHGAHHRGELRRERGGAPAVQRRDVLRGQRCRKAPRRRRGRAA